MIHVLHFLNKKDDEKYTERRRYYLFIILLYTLGIDNLLFARFNRADKTLPSLAPVMANTTASTVGISPVGAGVSLVVLLTFDLIGHIVLMLSIFLHIRKGKERNLSPRTGFHLLLYYVILEFIYSVTVEGLSSLCYLSTAVDLMTSHGLCIFQAWLGSTLLLSNMWITTLLIVERLLVRTRLVLLNGQSKSGERFFYACYTGIIVTALVALVPVTRDGSIRTFEPSHSFCHFDYNITTDPLMTSFNICIIVVTVILFQVQFYSFVAILFEEYRAKQAVKNIQKFKYKEHDVSQNQEYWYNRHKHRHSFAGKHEWNFTLMILALSIWMWMCLFPSLVIFIKAQSGGVVTPKASFVAVRMLSIHNAINSFIPILIFSPFRQRALHFVTCGQVEYSRDDFILSNISENDVTRNSEPNWWKVIENNQWQTSTQADGHREMMYVYEKSIDGDEDSYYDSEYESYTSHGMDDYDNSSSARTNQGSVYYLDQEGHDATGDDYLLAVPVNKPGAGSGETVERIFILHESSNTGQHCDGYTSRRLSRTDVSNSPKLRKVVQSREFKELLRHRRLNDKSPRLFKVSDSPGCQSENATVDRPVKGSPVIEPVALTPKLKRIVQSSAFKKMLLMQQTVPKYPDDGNLAVAEPVVIETDSSSSPENEMAGWKAIGTTNMEAKVNSSTPKLKAVVRSPEFKRFVLKEKQNDRSPKFGKVSKIPDLITVVETKPKESSAFSKRTSPKRLNSDRDVELIEISDGSVNSVERQINTPEKINKSKERRKRYHEKGELKRERRKHRHSIPVETEMLKDAGTKPLQVLGLSPKYNKDKIEENGLFSKRDNRPEVLNALFQKALLVGTSTDILVTDEVETKGQVNQKIQKRYSKNKSDEEGPLENESNSAVGATDDEILFDGYFERNGSKRKICVADDGKQKSPSKGTGKVSFHQLSQEEGGGCKDAKYFDAEIVVSCEEKCELVDLQKKSDEHVATEMIAIEVVEEKSVVQKLDDDVIPTSDLEKERLGVDSLDDDSGENEGKISDEGKEFDADEKVREENKHDVDKSCGENDDWDNATVNIEESKDCKNITKISVSENKKKKNDVIYDVIYEEITEDLNEHSSNKLSLMKDSSSDESPLRQNVDIFVNSVIEKIMAENFEGGNQQGHVSSEVLKA